MGYGQALGGGVNADAFHTQRLTLGAWQTVEREALEAMFRPEVTRALPPLFHGAGDDAARRSVLRQMEAEADVHAIFEAAEPIGLLLLSTAGSDRHIGYLLRETAWGRGLAGELIAGVQCALASAPEITGLIAGVTHDNPASARVLERAGFKVIEKRSEERIFRWINAAAG